MLDVALPQAFLAHRTLLWRLCYRMTGSAADADDLVQETFARALERPPADFERDLRPWLVRIAVNLSRDHLRARKRRGYDGPYLAAPIDTTDWPTDEATHPDVRYGELESVTLAFLHALEALTPKQRAVLILCDVSGYSVRETAEALGMSEANVKTTHHRARSALAAYDAARVPLTRELQRETRSKLERLLWYLNTRDVPALEALLAADVEALNDADGEFFAARLPVRGRAKVALFHLKTQRHGTVHGSIRMLNGLPALVAAFEAEDLRLLTAKKPPSARGKRVAPRVVLAVHPARDGRISKIYAQVASAKLRRVTFDGLDTPRRFLARTLWMGLRDSRLGRHLAGTMLRRIQHRGRALARALSAASHR